MKYLISTTLLLMQFSAYAGKLDKIIDTHSGRSQISVKFVRLSDKKVLFQRNSTTTLVPASTSKLVTAAAALTKLKSDYSYNTPVFYDGTIKKGVLSGNLYIKGAGDPFLVSEKLWEMATDLHVLGLKKVEGNIVVDQSLFDSQDRDQSRSHSAKYSRNAYDAPILPFSVNFNTFSVAAAVDRTTGKPKAQIWPYPLPGVVKINNRLKVSQVDGKLKVDRVTRAGQSTVSLSGSISEMGGLKKYWKSVSDGNKASGQYFKSFLAAASIRVEGQIRNGQVPNTAKELYKIKGYPISKSINGLNKYSNNFIADMLTKLLGAKANGKGTFKNGAQQLEAFMRSEIGIKSALTLKNGSGLSTENKLSADQLCQLLVYMQKHLEIFPEFLASLPASRVDGTLKDRFKSYGVLKGKVRAKTGTLTQPVSVSSLAGYYFHKTHGWVAFAIIENGRKGKAQPSIAGMRRIQEKLVYQL